MTIQPFVGNSNLPFLMKLEVPTKQLFDNGMMQNGVHVEDMHPIQTYLDVLEVDNMTIHCTTCKNVIPNGQVAGSANYCLRGWFCLDCLTMPPFPIEGYKITYKTRKTFKTPNGIKTTYVINEQHICGQYIRDVDLAVEGMEVEKIFPAS